MSNCLLLDSETEKQKEKFESSVFCRYTGHGIGRVSSGNVFYRSELPVCSRVRFFTFLLQNRALNAKLVTTRDRMHLRVLVV